MSGHQTEREKLRGMTFAEKRWYIWTYYKAHIFALVVLAFLVGGFINRQLNPPTQEFLYVVWLGPIASFGQLIDLADALEIIVEDPERQAVFISDFTETEDRRLNANLRERFSFFLQAGDFDMFITTRQGAYELAGQRFIRPVDEVVQGMNIEHLLLAIEPEEEMLAVSLAGSPLLYELGIEASDIYMCVVVNTRRVERVAKALEVLLYGA